MKLQTKFLYGNGKYEVLVHATAKSVNSYDAHNLRLTFLDPATEEEIEYILDRETFEDVEWLAIEELNSFQNEQELDFYG